MSSQCFARFLTWTKRQNISFTIPINFTCESYKSYHNEPIKPNSSKCDKIAINRKDKYKTLNKYQVNFFQWIQYRFFDFFLRNKTTEFFSSLKSGIGHHSNISAKDIFKFMKTKSICTGFSCTVIFCTMRSCNCIHHQKEIDNLALFLLYCFLTFCCLLISVQDWCANLLLLVEKLFYVI